MSEKSKSLDPRDQKVIWFCGKKLLIISNHLPGLVPIDTGSSDTEAKIFYVTFHDHVIKGSGEFMEGNSTLYILTFPILIAIDIMLMGT